MLPNSAITEYKRIFKGRYGVDLGDQEAIERANNLVNLYRVVYDKRDGVRDSRPPNFNLLPYKV